MADLNTTNFQETIINLSETVNSVDNRKIVKILEKYETIPQEYKNLQKLTRDLKRLHPHLFSKDIVLDNNKIISLKQQERNKQKILDSYAKKIHALNSLEKMTKYLEGSQEKTEEIKNKLEKIFPSKNYEHSFRVKEPINILKANNLKKMSPFSDIIGLRTIPQKSLWLPQTVEKFEKNFGHEIAYKTNSFAYTQRELIKRKGKNSIYYRAIHYHLSANKFFAEIQIRTPAIDQWSKLSRATIYKTRRKFPNQAKKYIMEFGRRANIVDYFEIINDFN